MDTLDRSSTHDAALDERSPHSLASRLRTTLQAARGNIRVREQLVALVSDPARFDPIVRQFGPGHSLILALRELADHDQLQLVRSS